MKVAVAYENGNVWQHFGKTENFKIYEIENKKIVSSEVVSTNGQGHGALADFLADQKADVVICGGVGSPMVGKLEAYGMKVYAGVTGDADDGVKAFIDGSLTGNASAIHDGCHHH